MSAVAHADMAVVSALLCVVTHVQMVMMKKKYQGLQKIHFFPFLLPSHLLLHRIQVWTMEKTSLTLTAKSPTPACMAVNWISNTPTMWHTGLCRPIDKQGLVSGQEGPRSNQWGCLHQTPSSQSRQWESRNGTLVQIDLLSLYVRTQTAEKRNLLLLDSRPESHQNLTHHPAVYKHPSKSYMYVVCMYCIWVVLQCMY